MLDAPKRRALDGDGVRVEGIDLHDPAEAVRLVRVFCGVEALVVLLPARISTLRRDGVALLIGRDRAAIHEVDMPVLFASKVRPPRRPAVRATGVGAAYDRAARIVRGAHQGMTGRRPADSAGRACGDPAGKRRWPNHIPLV